MLTHQTAPFFLAVGDPLVALIPDGPVSVEKTERLQIHIGGAEVNTAIGVSRLGVSAGWLGRIGDDPMGRRVARTLCEEGVDTSLIVTDPGARTGIYLREWAADGPRRPYYYRSSGGGARLEAADWPVPWPEGVAVPAVVHVTGITPALSAGAADALHTMIDRARHLGAVISVDPNYRPELWADEDTARAALGRLAAAADILLLSEDDAGLLFASTEPTSVLAKAVALGPHHVVFKRGARGAVVAIDGSLIQVDPEPVGLALDSVGAGDGFNAGFLAALLHGASADDAARCGAWCGARAVEMVGECEGYPTRDKLPDHLAKLFEEPMGLAIRNLNGSGEG